MNIIESIVDVNIVVRIHDTLASICILDITVTLTENATAS